MNKNKIKAFTLVELIIVITILAILATIGFMSFSSYMAWARDSNRVTDVKTLYSRFQMNWIKFVTNPSPDSSLPIVPLWYQWYAWDTVKKNFKLSGDFKDPLNKTDYIYLLWANNISVQLGTYLEEKNWILLSFFDKTYAWSIDYTNRYLYTVWDKMWIVTDSSTKAPIQDIYTWATLTLSTYTGALVLYTASGTISGTWWEIVASLSSTGTVIEDSSCKLWTTFKLWSCKL